MTVVLVICVIAILALIAMVSVLWKNQKNSIKTLNLAVETLQAATKLSEGIGATLLEHGQAIAKIDEMGHRIYSLESRTAGDDLKRKVALLSVRENERDAKMKKIDEIFMKHGDRNEATNKRVAALEFKFGLAGNAMLSTEQPVETP